MTEYKNNRLVTDARTCHYCLEPITVLTRTRDHVVPRLVLSGDWIFDPTLFGHVAPVSNSDKASMYPTCRCSFCTRTKRRHWELLRIKDPVKKTRKR
jgi:hypothetical protein